MNNPMIDIMENSEWMRAESYKTRLAMIAQVIERVDQRCAAVDGPITPTLQEMTPFELKKIYILASKHRKPRKRPQ